MRNDYICQAKGLWRNLKIIGNYIYTSAYDKRDDVGFPIVDFT